MTENRIAVTRQGQALPRALRLEIRLVACMIPLVNLLCSPDRAARLLEPRRRRLPSGDTFPVDLVCYLGKLLEKCLLMRKSYCIRRSYLLYRYLRLYGFAATLNFGLRGEGREQGHCWVSLDGDVFFDETEPAKVFRQFVGATDRVVYWIW